MGAALPIRDDISVAELRRLARLEEDGRVACRLLALANALDGMSRAVAAEQAGMDRQTLRDWVIRFNAVGVKGLCDRPRSGRPSFLNEGQLASLKAPPRAAARGPFGEGSIGCSRSMGAAWPRPGAGRPQQLDGQGSVPPGRGPSRRDLQRERHAAAAARSRPVLAEDPAGASAGRPESPAGF
jgi:hypothetical protein